MNRRHFLKQSSSALLALTAASYVPTTFAADKIKRVGLIGAGWYGKSDLWRLVQVAPVEIVSICDPDKHMLAEAVKIAGERTKASCDLDSEFLEQLPAHMGLVHAFGHARRIQRSQPAAGRDVHL